MNDDRNKQRQTTSPPLVGASPSSEALLREGPEPTVDVTPLPVLFIALSALLIYAAARNMNNRGGEFDPRVYYPYANLLAVIDAHPRNPADRLRLLGKQTFNSVGCVSCHQASGQGVPGQFPPLAGSDWVLGEGPNRIIRVVLNGFSGPVQVSGGQFNNSMLPFEGVLDDEKIAAVLTYVRSDWGNKGAPITPDQVKKIRALVAGHAPWSADELKKIPEKD